MENSLYREIAERIEGRLCIEENEAVLLAETVKDSQVHVQIGCIWGDTAILAALSGAGQVCVIDPMAGGFWEGGDPIAGKTPTPQTLLSNLERFGVSDRVQVIRSASHPWPLIGVQPDTVMIDGDHTYQACLQDWKTASSIALKAVIFHDVDERHPDVQRVISEHASKSAIWRRSGSAGCLVVFERISSPLVSVIVPTRNRPELLERALESIAGQTMGDYEVLVVNDAGEDVAELVKAYPKIEYFRHKANKGLAAARNTAAANAKGFYVAYLDDDDWYYKNHLETLIGAISNNHRVRAVYSDAHCVERYVVDRRVYISKDYDAHALREHNLFPVCCMLHERSLFKDAGNFDEELKNHEDWDLWIRMSEHTDFLHVAIPTCVIDRTRKTMNSDRPTMLAGFQLIKERYGG